MNDPESDSHDAFVRSDNAGLRKKSVRGAVFMASAGVIESVARLIATVVLARLLSPAQIGLVAMVVVLVGLIEFIKDLGLGVVTVQRLNISHREVSSLFWINTLLGLFFALALCALAPAISAFYGDDRIVSIALALSTTLILSGVSVQPEALLSRQMKQGPIAFMRLMSTVVSSVIAIVAAVLGFDYWSLVIREIARSLLYLLGVWWYCRWVPSLLLLVREVADHIRQGANLSMSFVLTAVVRQMDGILVGRYFGAADLGVYRQAQGLVVAPIEQFNGPVFDVANRGLSALQEEHDRYARYYQRVVAFVAMVTMPVGIFIAIYAAEFTLVTLGRKWVAATPFVCAFAVAMSVRPTVQTSLIILVTLGRSKSMLALETIHTVLFAALMIVGLQVSALGVAVAFVAVTLLSIPLRLHFSFRDSPVSIKTMLLAIGLPVGATIFMALSVTYFRYSFPMEQAALSLIYGISVSLATYSLPWLVLPSGRLELKAVLVDIQSAMRRKRNGSNSP